MDTTTLRLASIGIDIGKEVFHIVGLSAHLVSRALRQLGHEPRIIPAIYVKPFVKGQKNDYNDAEAIAEASLRPNCVPCARRHRTSSISRPATAFAPVWSRGEQRRSIRSEPFSSSKELLSGLERRPCATRSWSF